MLGYRTSKRSQSRFLHACRYVQEVHDQHLLVQISTAIKSRISIFDSADDPEELSQFAQRFTPGQPIQCRVSQVSTRVAIIYAAAG